MPLLIAAMIQNYSVKISDKLSVCTLLSLSVLGAFACGSAYPSNIPRRLSGRSVLGAYVAPLSYESLIRAERLMALGDFDNAITSFQQAADSSTDDPWLIARLAHAQTCANNIPDALRTIEAGLSIFADHRWLRLETDFARVRPTLHAPEIQARCRVRFEDEPARVDDRLSAGHNKAHGITRSNP